MTPESQARNSVAKVLDRLISKLEDREGKAQAGRQVRGRQGVSRLEQGSGTGQG